MFGGSIYGALDPIYMVQLINILGKDYVVWDKSASIRFIKPIKKKVFAKFLLSDKLLADIIQKVASESSYTVQIDSKFEDEQGIVYAIVSKQIYIANKSYYTTLKTEKI